MTDLVATFIARPERAADLATVAAEAASVAGSRIEWLADGEACDVRFAPEPGFAAELQSRLAALAVGRPVDVIVQPAADRRKKLLVADMDSTIIGQECLDELADYAGLRAPIAAITERAMQGEIAFEPALRERVSMLAGLPVALVERVIRERIKANSGAATLVRTMHADHAYTVLVSGGFSLFTEPVAAAIGFDEQRANRLKIDDGKLAGRVAEPILGRNAKLETLRGLRQRLGLRREQTLAVGDGANDLAMLADAGLGVAFHSKPAVAAAAAARVDHNDLTALLFAQGYRRTEFVIAAEVAI